MGIMEEKNWNYYWGFGRLSEAYGLGFRVWGLEFRVQGLGFRVQGLGIMVHGSGMKVLGFGLRDKRAWVASESSAPPNRAPITKIR